MKRIIDGRKYDTNTATCVGEWDNGCSYRDFSYCCEKLYRKCTGEYFLWGEGGPLTKYCEYVGHSARTGGEDIKPLTEAQARRWAEEHLSGDEYEEIFGEVEE